MKFGQGYPHSRGGENDDPATGYPDKIPYLEYWFWMGMWLQSSHLVLLPSDR